MSRLVCLSVLLCTLGTALHAQPEDWDRLQARTLNQLEEIAGRSPGILGFAVQDLISGETFLVNDTIYPQGSSIKIAVLWEVLRQARSGRFSMEQPQRVTPAQQVGGSGILGYFGEGSAITVRDLATLMIVLSDNTATNMLIDHVGMDSVNRSLQSQRLVKTRLQRKMMDAAARGRGDENISSPGEAMELMAGLWRGEGIHPEDREEMLRILRIPKPGSVRSAVPSTVAVAFKPGGIPGVSVIWAIVELPERPFVFVAMEKLGVEGRGGSSLIQEAARLMFEYFQRLATATRYGTYVAPDLIRR